MKITNQQVVLALVSVALVTIAGYFFFRQIKPLFKTGDQYTFALIKPDAVAAKKIGKIITLIEDNGFEIEALQERLLSKQEVENYYAEHKDKPFFKDLVEFMTSGPVVLMVLKKDNAVADWRALMGVTDPGKAAEGTVRKLFGTSITKNAVHGSDSAESAQKEIGLLFPSATNKQ